MSEMAIEMCASFLLRGSMSECPPRKIPWISLDSFGRIGTFQWVMTNPNKKNRRTLNSPPGLCSLKIRTPFLCLLLRLVVRAIFRQREDIITYFYLSKENAGLLQHLLLVSALFVMAGLVPAIHAGNASRRDRHGAARSKVLQAQSFRPCRAHEHSMRRTTWIAGTSPAMTPSSWSGDPLITPIPTTNS